MCCSETRGISKRYETTSPENGCSPKKLLNISNDVIKQIVNIDEDTDIVDRLEKGGETPMCGSRWTLPGKRKCRRYRGTWLQDVDEAIKTM